MRKTAVFVLALLIVAFLGIFAQAQEADSNAQAMAEIINAEGEVVGTASFTTTENGVEVRVELNDFTSTSSGEHGIHIHQVGECAPSFQAAGSHFSPLDNNHGYLSPNGPHAGDLPNIRIDANGNASYSFTTNLITLEEGERAILDADGAALIIHAQPDNYLTDPSGSTGDRIACGVITSTAAQSTQAASPATAQASQAESSATTEMIQLPDGYQIEKVVDGLSFPTSLTWDDQGRMYVAEAGGAFLELDAPARILRVEPGQTTEIANLSDTIIAPLVGLEWHDGAFYITHRATEDRTGAVSRVTMDGQVVQLFRGFLDAASEHMLSDIQAGPDGQRIYFTSGPAGNAAVLGVDEKPYVQMTPHLHTTPCEDIVLLGRNFLTKNFLTDDPDDRILTGAYVPFGTETRPGQVIEGVQKCGGAILSFDPASPNPEETIRTHAWGFRNVIGIAWNPITGEMYAAENGYDIRGARPVRDYYDTTFRVREGEWYGYPDFSRTLEPLTLPKYEVQDDLQAPIYVLGELVGSDLAFVIDHEASGLDAPDPSLVLARHDWQSSPSMMDVAPASWGEWAGHLFVAEWGDLRPTTNPLTNQPVGYQVVRVEPETGQMERFVWNLPPEPPRNQGELEKGMERPFDVKFGPDGAMYIVDFGVVEQMGRDQREWLPQTGVIWKVTRTGQ